MTVKRLNHFKKFQSNINVYKPSSTALPPTTQRIIFKSYVLKSYVKALPNSYVYNNLLIMSLLTFSLSTAYRVTYSCTKFWFLEEFLKDLLDIRLKHLAAIYILCNSSQYLTHHCI